MKTGTDSLAHHALHRRSKRMVHRGGSPSLPSSKGSFPARLLLLPLAAALFIALLFCNPHSIQAQTSAKEELILALQGEPQDGFDPILGWGRYGNPLFQSTLLARDNDLKIIKDLATDYSVSDDGLTWTIAIRKDVKFSTGKPLTAKDVAFNLQHGHACTGARWT